MPVDIMPFCMGVLPSGLAEKETKRWCKWAEKRPAGRIVAVCIMAQQWPKQKKIFGCASRQ
jgi:hypothetical protein